MDFTKDGLDESKLKTDLSNNHSGFQCDLTLNFYSNYTTFV